MCTTAQVKEDHPQSTWPQPCSLLARGSSGGRAGRGIILLVAIHFLQYFNEQSKLESRKGPGRLCLHRPVSPGTDITVPAVPLSQVLPATGTANTQAQTPLCPSVHAPIRVPYTHLSPGEHLQLVLTPSAQARHAPRCPACVHHPYWGAMHLPTLDNPASWMGWSILKNLTWVRADTSNACLGGGAETKVWEKSRAACCLQT